MCLYTIATEYNGPLEAAHAHIDDVGSDMDDCNAAGKFKWDLISHQAIYVIVAWLVCT